MERTLIMTPENKDKMKLSNQLCFPLYAAARRVTASYNPYLKPLGLTYTQYVVFLVLWEEDGLTVGEICKRLYLDNGTLTPLLKKMEKENYVRRERSKEDERVVTVHLTDKGKELQEKAAEIPELVGSCMNLPRKKKGQLYMLLYELLQSYECDVPQIKEQ